MSTNIAPIEKPLAEIYGRNSFLKAKNDYFAIGKVLFSFVQTGKTAETSVVIKNIDCCLDVYAAIVFAKDLLDGALDDQIANTAETGFIWKSVIGGIHEDEVAQRKLRKDGKAIARYFGIQSANKGFCRFTAMQMPGNSAENGLIVPCSGKADAVITVPVESREKLREFGAGILMGIFSYTAGLYASSWARLEEKREKYRCRKPENQTGVENNPAGKETGQMKKVIYNCYWSVEKGSVIKKHGKSDGSRILRLVVPRIFEEDAPLATDYKWQMADVLFDNAAVLSAPKELQKQIHKLVSQAEANSPTGSIRNLPLKICGVKDGYRQLTFISS